jgi:transposase InsO family protein
MKVMELQGVVRGKPVITTNPDTKQPCPQDRVNRIFVASMPNQIWTGDITYSAPRPGWPGVHMTGMH